MLTAFRPALGANPERARSHNRQLVLSAVRTAGAVGRAEIARRSGLSTQAVSNIIADLLQAGLLCEKGQLSAGRGMPVQQYAVQPGGGYGFGVEIRPHAMFSALVDLVGTPIYTHRTPLGTSRPEAILQIVAGEKARAIAKAGLTHRAILGAGIVMPGPFGATGLQSMGSELPGWQDIDPERAFSAELDMPVFVENDANAAAMAEQVSGEGRELHSFAYLYFGQGLGLGLIQNGQLVRGAFGNAGEIGHIPIPLAGRTRLLEDSVSRMSVERALREAGITATTMSDIAALFARYTPELDAWLHEAALALAPALTIVENLFDPQTIILGGAMPEAILDHLIQGVAVPHRSVSNRTDRTHPRLTRGTCGRMTATLGAASLVLDQAFAPAQSASR